MTNALLVTYRFGYQPDLSVHLPGKEDVAMDAEDRTAIFQLCEAVIDAKNADAFDQAVERLLAYVSDRQRLLQRLRNKAAQDQGTEPATPLIDLLENLE